MFINNKNIFLFKSITLKSI